MTPSGVFLSLSLENFIRKRLLSGEKPGRSNMNMNKIFIQKWDNYVAGNHGSRKSIKKLSFLPNLELDTSRHTIFPLFEGGIIIGAKW